MPGLNIGAFIINCPYAPVGVDFISPPTGAMLVGTFKSALLESTAPEILMYMRPKFPVFSLFLLHANADAPAKSKETATIDSFFIFIY